MNTEFELTSSIQSDHSNQITGKNSLHIQKKKKKVKNVLNL